MDPFLHMFDDPVFVRARKKAGFSTTVIVALVALAIIVAAWWLIDTYDKNKTNNIDAGDVDPYTVVPESTENGTGNEQSVTTPDQGTIAAARLKTRNDLVAIQMNLQSNQNYQEALLLVEELETDLEQAYAHATGTARASFDALKLELDDLENTLRSSSAESLTMLAALIARLGEEVRVDESKSEYK